MPLEKIFGKLLGNSLHHDCNQCLHHFYPRIITSFNTTTPCTTPCTTTCTTPVSEQYTYKIIVFVGNKSHLAKIASNCDWETDKKENG